MWLAMARAATKSMLTRTDAAATSGTGPAITGVLVPQPIVTAQLITDRDQSAVSDVTPQSVQAALFSSGSIRYDAAAGKTYLAFTRPLAAGGHPSEMDVNPYASQGYTYAVGSDGAFGYHASADLFTLRLVPATCSRFGTCSGHGRCAADGVTCVCDAGYTGYSCAKCALGFIAGAGPGECVAAPAAISGNVAVRMTVRLSLAWSVAGEPGTGTRAGFVASLLHDLSTASGIPVSRFNVSSLRAGSIIADITILPPPTTSPTAASPTRGAATSSSTTMAMLPAPVLAARIGAMLADPTSALLSPSASPVMSSIDSSTPASFESFAAGPSTYAFSRPLGGGLTLSWRPQGADVAFKLAYDGSAGDVWYSAGVNSEPSMVGGDVVVFQPSGLAGAQVRTHVMSGYTASEVVPVDAAADPASAIVVTRGTGSSSSIEFTRPAAAGAYDGAQSWAVAGGPLWFVWAVGASRQASLARHTNAGAGTVQIDLATGATSVESTRNMRAAIAHAVCMFVGLCVLAPLGVFAARYGKAEAAAAEKATRRAAAAAGSGTAGAGLTADMPSAPLWLRLHRAIVMAAAALAIAGFIAAIVTVNSSSKHASHFTGGPHQRLGFAVIFFVLLQPLAAAFRPLRRPEGQRQTRCRAAWEFAHAASGYFILIGAAAAAFLGFPLLDLPPTVTAAYGMLLAALGAFALWREFLVRCWRPTVAPVIVLAYGAGKGGKLASAGAGGGAQAARVLANPMRAAAAAHDGEYGADSVTGVQMAMAPLPGSPAAVAVANPLQRTAFSPEATASPAPAKSHKVRIMPGLGEPEEHHHGHGLAGSAGAAAAAVGGPASGLATRRPAAAVSALQLAAPLGGATTAHASAALSVVSANGRQTRASMTPRLVDKRASIARLQLGAADDAAAAAAAAGGGAAFGIASATAAGAAFGGVSEGPDSGALLAAQAHAFSPSSHAPLHDTSSYGASAYGTDAVSAMPGNTGDGNAAALVQLPFDPRSASVSARFEEATAGWGDGEGATSSSS